jgi:hypothetical protein
MHQVVDSNFLGSDRLLAYLREHQNNFAVFPDYTAMEAYKGNTLNSIFKSMLIVSRYPSQIVILKGTQEICGLVEVGLRLRKRMIDRDQTRGFSEYCKHLRAAERGDKMIQAQVLEHGKAASTHLETILKHAEGMASVLKDMQANFTMSEVRSIRGGGAYERGVLDKVVAQAMLLAAHLFRIHPLVRHRTSSRALPHRFIFRFALSTVLWFVDWIETGSQTDRRPERTRNDLVDLQIITYASYFDGLLSSDRKAVRLHSALKHFLSVVFGVE